MWSLQPSADNRNVFHVTPFSLPLIKTFLVVKSELEGLNQSEKQWNEAVDWHIDSGNARYCYRYPITSPDNFSFHVIATPSVNCTFCTVAVMLDADADI